MFKLMQTTLNCDVETQIVSARASHMLEKHSTTELQPQPALFKLKLYAII